MMLKSLLPAFILFSWAGAYGQVPNPTLGRDLDQQLVARQVLVNSLENEIQDVQPVAVRSLVRYRVASWLWQGGKDDTGNARTLAIKALDELYGHRQEVPDRYRTELSARVFSLLETNSPEEARRLREKHDNAAAEDLNSAFSLLEQEGSAALVSEKLIRSVQGQSEISPQAILLIDEFASRNSPELIKVLATILDEEESRLSHYSAESLFYLMSAFRGRAVSTEFRRRFYLVAIMTARDALFTGEGDLTSSYDLINASLPDIAVNAKNLLAQATILRNALSSKVAKPGLEYREAIERIEKAPDRLPALIAEAENSDSKELSEALFTDAANLALAQRDIKLAINLLEKVADLRNGKSDKNFGPWHDQFLGNVCVQSLKANDPLTCSKVSKKVFDRLSRAEILRRTALHYYDQHDVSSASSILNDSLSLANQTENGPGKATTMLRLMLAFEKIDKPSVPKVIGQALRILDSLPPLSIDDKPGSEAYTRQVNSIMAIDTALLPAFLELLKEDRNGAMDFANRIKRKEIRIITSYALMVDSLTPVATNN